LRWYRQPAYVNLNNTGATMFSFAETGLAGCADDLPGTGRSPNATSLNL